MNNNNNAGEWWNAMVPPNEAYFGAMPAALDLDPIPWFQDRGPDPFFPADEQNGMAAPLELNNLGPSPFGGGQASFGNPAPNIWENLMWM